MTKEEYMKYQVPEEYERRMALIRKGAENAKKQSEKKRSMLERKARKKKRIETSDRYGI